MSSDTPELMVATAVPSTSSSGMPIVSIAIDLFGWITRSSVSIDFFERHAYSKHRHRPLRMDHSQQCIHRLLRTGHLSRRSARKHEKTTCVKGPPTCAVPRCDKCKHLFELGDNLNRHEKNYGRRASAAKKRPERGRTTAVRVERESERKDRALESRCGGETRRVWSGAGMKGGEGGNERSPRKPADQCHRPARYPHEPGYWSIDVQRKVGTVVRRGYASQRECQLAFRREDEDCLSLPPFSSALWWPSFSRDSQPLWRQPATCVTTSTGPASGPFSPSCVYHDTQMFISRLVKHVYGEATLLIHVTATGMLVFTATDMLVFTASGILVVTATGTLVFTATGMWHTRLYFNWHASPHYNCGRTTHQDYRTWVHGRRCRWPTDIARTPSSLQLLHSAAAPSLLHRRPVSWKELVIVTELRRRNLDYVIMSEEIWTAVKRTTDVSMEQSRNERGGGETGDPRVNPPNNGIVQHDSHTRRCGVTRPGIVLVGALSHPGAPIMATRYVIMFHLYPRCERLVSAAAADVPTTQALVRETEHMNTPMTLSELAREVVGNCRSETRGLFLADDYKGGNINTNQQILTSDSALGNALCSVVPKKKKHNAKLYFHSMATILCIKDGGRESALTRQPSSTCAVTCLTTESLRITRVSKLECLYAVHELLSPFGSPTLDITSQPILYISAIPTTVGDNPEKPMVTKSGDTVWHRSFEFIDCIQNSITQPNCQRFKDCYFKGGLRSYMLSRRRRRRRIFEFVSPRLITSA
ncbi:hypothetical protein PR048_007152 [Dryococelus australis]|uniref:C2H2-type domain-containing protein n=1 Tax=Dryococelus australis TaxID=614101 RepID=A0ABQ9ICU7_9NEOP|nr:hypothetical protein PR048_007152 [Dryococelus australis]